MLQNKYTQHQFKAFFHTILALILTIGYGLKARALGWGFIALLATVAFFSARLALETQYHDPKNAFTTTIQKHLPDYTINGLKLWRTSLDGTTRNHLQADNLIHYRDDLSATLKNPVLTAQTQSTAPNFTKALTLTTTTITAEQGLLRNDGELIQFNNHVKIVRNAPATQPSTIQTDSLTLLPDSNRVMTHSPILLSQGKHTSVAQGGIEYIHNDAILHLIGPVHTVLMPTATTTIPLSIAQSTLHTLTP